MNRIRSLIPATWWSVSGCSFLLAVLLASPGLPGAEGPSASRPVTTLDNPTATKLLIHVEKPRYPAIAKVNLIQGAVKLRITVNANGKVIVAHVVAGEPVLAAAAIAAVQRWRYRPYHSSDGAEAFSTYVVVKFILHPRTIEDRFPEDPDGFLEKQVHPPEVVTRTRSEPSSRSARFKVLVDSKGEVLDATPLEADGADVELARENLRHWKFRPARWGALAVPWYAIVKVPFEHSPADQAAYSARH